MEVAVYQPIPEKLGIDNRTDISSYTTTEETETIKKKTEYLLLNCRRCLAAYSDERVPRTLRCGHSLCTPCSEQCLADQRDCPECQEKLVVKSVSDIPVNYPLLRLIRSLVGDKVDIGEVKVPDFVVDISCSSSPEDVWMCFAHSNPIVSLCCSCSVWVCQDCMVADHPSLPRGSCRMIGLKNAMDRIRGKHQDTANHILKDIEDVKRSFDYDMAIHDFCLKYCPLDSKNHTDLVQELKIQLDEVKSSNICFVEKAKERLKRSTETTTSPYDLTTSCQELHDYKIDLEKEIPTENEKKTPVLKLIVKHLRLDLKMLVQGMKPVYAVTEEDREGPRWALITIKDDHLLLYSLNKGNPPKEGITVPFQYVKKLIPKLEAQIFFEVGTAEEDFGRMYVRLWNDNPGTQQLKLMCSGENGVSYKGTSFYGLDEKEGLLMEGDYEKNDGTGGITIVSGLGDYYTSSLYQGVTGALVTSRVSTRFHFHLHNVVKRWVEEISGIVIAGKHLLKRISKIQPITKSMIRDCGLFIQMKPTYED